MDQNVNVVVGKFVVLNDWKRRILTAYSYFSSFNRIFTYHGKGDSKVYLKSQRNTLYKLVLAAISVGCMSLPAAHTAMAADYKPIILDPSYEHDKWQTQPQDHVFEFAAYTTSFDGADDNDGDGDSDRWGIPEWVSFEIKKISTDHHLDKRPTWLTDKELYEEGIAPNDETYAVSGVREMEEVKTDYRFVRGHMCPKDTAERISTDAAYNTHTVLNACPQLQWQNNGIWKDLEGRCHGWADEYERVWVICGPVFFGREPALWLGQNGEKKAAIPDAFYKIVARESGDSVDTLAFLIPNILPKTERNLGDFVTSIDRIESLTGLDFLTALDDESEDEVEREKACGADW